MSDNDQIARLADLLTKKEPLHEDLQDYVERDGQWPMLRHPLVYAVPYMEHSNALLNQSYMHKIAATQKARMNGDYSQYIWLYERAWRLTAFFDICHELSDADYWRILSQIWTDSENVFQTYDEWREIFLGNYEDARKMCDPDELAVLNSLPETVTVYRGFNHRDGQKGLSWTLDPDIATFFAKRFGRQSRIATAVIRKDKILAYLSGRGESEIVAFHDDMESIKVKKA